jgi:transposase
MARKLLILDEENRKRLKRVVDRGTNWRERQRAQTLLLLGEGMLSKNVAHQLGIHARTVGTTRSEWLASGMASLADRPRSGAPRKLKPEHVQRLLAWATAQPLTAPALLAYHKEQGGPCVHLNTLRNVLRLVNLVWKRTRHSLKNSRNEAAFRQAAVEIAALREQAAAGEIELAYADEAGFACVHPNRSAWTPVGGRHLIEAKRGKRLNVLGALLSSGKLFSAKLWTRVNSDLFVGFLGLLREEVGKPLTVILDNASIHKAKATRHVVEYLKKQGVTLYFLPAYSPELNRIERLWHKMKHTWMEVKCRTQEMLEADVSDILDNFGIKYKFQF